MNIPAPIQPFLRRIFVRIKPLIPQKNHVRSAALVVISVLVLFYAYQLLDAYRNVRQIKSLAYDFEAAVADRDLAGAHALLDGIMLNIGELNGNIRRLHPFTVMPPFNREVRAAKATLAAAEIGGIVGDEVLSWAETVPVLTSSENISYSSLTDAERQEILTAIENAPRLWDRVSSGLAIASTLLRQADESSRLPIVKNAATPALKKIREGLDYAHAVQPFFASLPSLLGSNEQKTYLLLLQNNTELRPTGGFIGTYGTLAVKNGAIVSFETDNVYNLDEPAKAYNEKIPPAPIRKYLKQSQWFFRDSNWDPDFPSSAVRAMQFYQDERGSVKSFDGVIAFTPNIIEDLLSVTGPIQVGDTEFSAENLVDILAYHVELGFREEGITIYNRKQIIDDLAQSLKERLFELSVAEMRDFSKNVFASFDQRHIMMYFNDPTVQDIVSARGWDGRILETQGDYVFFVDANLGSLKSDPAIQRTLSYSTKAPSEKEIVATVSMTYNHTGDFDWKTTRYRTYARLYVPLGAKLISVSGNEEQVAIQDEHNKTLFGTFISIEPGTSETLTFSYVLPQSVLEYTEREGYSLLVQKQGGTAAHALMLDLELPKNISTVNPSSILKKVGNNHVGGAWDLSTDRRIVLAQ